MVRSQIFEECGYLETKRVDTRDEDADLPLYEIQILNSTKVKIALGEGQEKPRYYCVKGAETKPLESDNSDVVVFYPIYLIDSINEDMVISRIGVYEVKKSNLEKFVDEDGDLLVTKLKPLLFSFVNHTFLSSHGYKSVPKALPTLREIEKAVVKQEQKKQTIEETSLTNAVVESSKQSVDADADETLQKEYPKQNEAQYTHEKTTKYLSRPLESDEHALQWCRAYFMNPNFKIVDKGGAGDNLFYTLASAINHYSQEHKHDEIPVFSPQDVASLREHISNAITEEEYEKYVNDYRKLTREKNGLTKSIRELIEEHHRVKQNFDSTSNKARQLELVRENKMIKDTIKKLENELIEVKEMLDAMKFMRSLKSKNDFKRFVMTPQYMGDEWALGVLQKYFNFKAIVLSQSAFIDQIRIKPMPLSEKTIMALKEVIKCNDKLLSNVKEPYFYIILNQTESHYQLVTYRDKEAFMFNELPFALRVRLARECLKYDSIEFSKIEEFREFRDENIDLMF